MTLNRDPRCPLDRSECTIDHLIPLAYSLIETEDTAFMSELEKLTEDGEGKVNLTNCLQKLKKVIGDRDKYLQ